MKIVACLREVLDPDILVFDPDQNQLAHCHSTMDPIGDQVLEAGLRLGRQSGGSVTAVCMAGPGAEQILSHALHQGADDALVLPCPQQTDTWARAGAMARGLARISWDLILTGAVSADAGNSFMPAALAAHLAVPFATHVIEVEKNGQDRLMAVKKLSQGKRETYALALPALVGCAPGMNTPRYVAPFSRVFQQGDTKRIRTMAMDPVPPGCQGLTRTIRIAPAKPRVKTGINISALSMADRMKMMRGELGTAKKEVFSGSPDEGARKIITHGKLD